MSTRKEPSTARKLSGKILEAKHAIDKLQKIAEMLVQPRIKTGYPVIKDYIYKNAPHAQRDSQLCQLPTEIMSMVFDYLKEDYDRVSLAMACKMTAGIFEAMKKENEPAANHSGIPFRLMVLTQLIEWMPPKYRLCVRCVRFRARKTKAQWFGDNQTEQRLKAIVRNPSFQDKSKQIMKARKTGSHCPTCAMHMKFNAVRDERVCRERLAKLESMLDEHNIIPRAGLGGKGFDINRQGQ